MTLVWVAIIIAQLILGAWIFIPSIPATYYKWRNRKWMKEINKNIDDMLANLQDTTITHIDVNCKCGGKDGFHIDQLK